MNRKFGSSKSGYTLIEILVVIALIAILSALGFSGYISYSRRQTLVQTGSEVKQTIERAKFNAASSVKPQTCTDSLVGYSFTINSNISYRLNLLCGTNVVLVETGSLPNNVSFDLGSTTCSQIQFQLISGGVTGGECKITIKGFGNQIILDVDRVGNVSLSS